MEIDVIKQKLSDKFNAPLPEFYTRRIVFWHDEEQSFKDAVDEIDIPSVKVLKLTGSNFFYAKKLLTVDDTSSNYLVYDPNTYADIKDNWLLDIELYSGEPFRADLVSMRMEELNITQSAPMRNLMKQYDKFFDSKNKKLLAKLKSYGGSYSAPGQLHIDIMAALCGAADNSPEGIIKAVLFAGTENNEAIASIEEFGDVSVFWSMVNKFVGYENKDDSILSLAAHILLTASSSSLPESVFKGNEQYVSYPYQSNCYAMVNEWLQNEDSSEVFDLCTEVEDLCNLYSKLRTMDPTELLASEIFPSVNEAILANFMEQISFNNVRIEDIRNTVEKRRTKKWYSRVQYYFDGLLQAANMQTFYQDHAAGFHETDYKEMWKNYISDYYQMDTYYRKFFEAYGRSLIDSNSRVSDAFMGAADYIENLYKTWFLGNLSSKWTALTKPEFVNGPVLNSLANQKNFYSSNVTPLVSAGTRAYVIISDALRFEVAKELAAKLTRDTKGNADVDGIQSVLPSVTKYGMAALLPNIKFEYSDCEAFCDGMPTEGTVNREKILKNKEPESVAIQYKDFIQMKQAEKREFVAGKNVVYIYHNVIDTIGEKAPTEPKVFEACEDAIRELFNLVKTITNDLSGSNVIITADHGFLYSYQKIEVSNKAEKDLVKGKLIETDRRYIITDSAKDAEHVIMIPLETYNCDYMLMVPQNIVRFKAGGGINFVHGGTTLQEMMVPVITFKNIRATSKKYVETTKTGIELTDTGRKISNSIFSLNFYQKEPVGGKVAPCKYDLFMSDASGKAVSDKQTIIADKTSENGADRMFRVRLTLKGSEFKNTETYYLNIVEQGATIPVDRVEYTIDISFAGDFDF